MSDSFIQPPRPDAVFTDERGKLTTSAFDFLYKMFLRLGGSLSSLNATQLEGNTWDSPQAIGTGTPNSGKFTTVQATSGFGCNGKTPQAAVLSDGTLATVIAALQANGIMH